jgi:uncharacterized RDD family membrane protein YckC
VADDLRSGRSASSSGGAVSGGLVSGGAVSLFRRFGALLVDWLLCLLAAGFVGSARRYPWAAPAVLVLEYTVFLGLIGQTPGMYLAKFRCVSLRGGPIGVPRALLRALLLILVLPAVVVDADRRGLHDRAAGSVLVRG